MDLQTAKNITADLGGVSKAGRALGIPKSTLSEYLNGKYRGKETRVLAVFLQYLNRVDCPMLGAITKEQCSKYYNMPFRATNSFNAKIKAACKTCLYGACNNDKE